MRFLLLTILLLPAIVSAQGESLIVGDRTIQYDNVHEGETAKLFYQGETMVASEHADITIVYENDRAVLQAFDTDDDGTLDAFVELDNEANIESVTGPGADTFARPETVEFEASLESDETDEEDLVGSLDSITIPRHGLPWFLILLLLVIGGFGYWYLKLKKQNSEN
jgi:hypothetical protein